ncbi:MAG TPA: PAS domain S-box protein, partial [Nitrospirota bacterium]|nr:PAS domain S-box protein [Nitrospirota bacterium]
MTGNEVCSNFYISGIYRRNKDEVNSHMFSPSAGRNPLHRFVIVLCLVAASALSRIPLHSVGMHLTYITFYPSLMAAALYGGLATGLLATGLSAVIVIFWVPSGWPSITDSGGWLGMGIFLINGMLISLMAEAKIRAQVRASKVVELELEVNRRKQVEEKLNEAYAELELRVEERTIELFNMNESLKAEIIERKKTEDIVRASEQRYRELFEGANDGIFLLDETGFIDCNQVGSEMYGIPKEQLMGRSLVDLSPERQPDGRLSTKEIASTIDTVMRGGPQRLEWQSLRGDGTPFNAEITLCRVDVGGKPCVQCIARDITERKRAESERMSLEAQLLQAQKLESVGRLAGGVAHDFNNMLSVILGYAELIKRRLPEGDPLWKDADEIQRAAIRSRDITRQLLAFSRQQIIEPRPVNLNDMVTDTQKTLARLIGEDIDLCFYPGKELWTIGFDPSQFDQILINLAVNARDAMPDGGMLTIETANISLDDAYCRDHAGFVPGDYVQLIVSDSGMGMDRETLSHAFEPFFTTK